MEYYEGFFFVVFFCYFLHQALAYGFTLELPMLGDSIPWREFM